MMHTDQQRKVSLGVASVVGSMRDMLACGCSVTDLRKRVNAIVLTGNLSTTLEEDMREDFLFLLEDCIHLACLESNTTYTIIV